MDAEYIIFFKFLLAWILEETSAYSKDKSLLISRKSDAKKKIWRRKVSIAVF